MAANPAVGGGSSTPDLSNCTSGSWGALLTPPLAAVPQGRPKSGPEDKFRLNPVAPRLSELIGKAVSFDHRPGG